MSSGAGHAAAGSGAGASMDATAWDERYRARDLVWSAGPNATVEAVCAPLSPGRALDLAAGEGRNAIWLAERGWEVEAVEFSSVAIDKGRQLAAHRGVEVTWTQADLTQPVALDPADLVLLVYLQLPPQQLAGIHPWAAGLVAAGGRFLLVAHARRNLEEGVGGPQDPQLLLSPDQVRDDLDGTGLELTRVEEVLRPVDTEDGPRDAIDLVVEGHRPR